MNPPANMPSPDPKSPANPRLDLAPGTWYAWTVVPGYLDYPHQSVILLHEARVAPGRKAILDISYRDAGYAQGVQDFERRVKVLAWTPHAMVCQLQNDGSDQRVATIFALSEHWVRNVWPDGMRKQAPGEGLQSLLNRLMR